MLHFTGYTSQGMSWLENCCCPPYMMGQEVCLHVLKWWVLVESPLSCERHCAQQQQSGLVSAEASVINWKYMVNIKDQALLVSLPWARLTNTLCRQHQASLANMYIMLPHLQHCIAAIPHTYLASRSTCMLQSCHVCLHISFP